MIIGNGMIAQGLRDLSSSFPDVTFFASGVSNSKNQNPDIFKRESELLDSFIEKSERLVYFGTMSIYDKERCGSSYVRHKIKMEKKVSNADRYTIFRLPEVIGKSQNNSTLVNFLYWNIISKNEFPLWKNAKRNLVDISDVCSSVVRLLKEETSKNSTINIKSDRDHPVLHLVNLIEKITQIHGKYVEIETPIPIKNDIAENEDNFLTSIIETDEDYLESVLRKHYE